MALELETRLADDWPPEQWHDLTVLVAVSGGSDSVALLRAMAALKTDGSGRLMAAHFNHATRGHESDEDEAFVVGLCRRLDVPCLVGRAAEDAASNSGGEGIEAALREARYEFLRHSAAQAGARYLVTGHTADDQAETILHRILRGTGIGGLAGMARIRPLGEATTLVRPLLGFRRAELVDYLDALGQPYRVDSSNANSQFTRNRLRHELLPLLAERYNPAIGEALLRLGNLAAEVQTVVDHLVRDLADRAIVEHGGRIAVNTAAVANEPRYLVRELLIAAWRGRGWPEQSMGRAEWDQLAEMLLTSRPRKKMFPGEVTARRDDDRLWL
ncbi:MAG: tRNA lysidine(34) synthetase TilS, partial [Pirellulales bacterium]|nr:tRNA lysidine(34) synthetase TilS [Pirellulales bacterium]